VTLALHTTALSANGRKPLALLHHLGVEAVVHEVNVYAGEGRDPAYLAVNPAGKVPTLVDGDFTLTESNAILVYLAERHDAGALWPDEPRARADILRWLFFEASQWQPALTGVLAAHVGHLLLPDVVPAPDAPPAWQGPALSGCLALLEGRLRDRAFLCGDSPSLADFSVGGMTTYFARTGFPAAVHPALAAWIGRLESLPAWRATAVPLWSDQSG